jgi:hypothetical protein
MKSPVAKAAGLFLYSASLSLAYSYFESFMRQKVTYVIMYAIINYIK